MTPPLGTLCHTYHTCASYPRDRSTGLETEPGRTGILSLTLNSTKPKIISKQNI